MAGPMQTAEDYLAQLPEDRRAALSTIREAVLKVLPTGYEETLQYGMITYVVPHSIYPDGYHCKPTDAVPYASISSQKNYMALYLHSIYPKHLREAFQERYLKYGKKLDMGACCVRFKKLEDLALEPVLDTIASMTVPDYLASYESLIPASKRKAKKA